MKIFGKEKNETNGEEKRDRSKLIFEKEGENGGIRIYESDKKDDASEQSMIETKKKTRSSEASDLYIDASVLGEYEIENNCGAICIRIEKTEVYGGSGCIKIENNCGSTVIYVPKEWRVVCDVENDLGSVKVPKHETLPDAPVLKIIGENNCGSLAVVFE